VTPKRTICESDLTDRLKLKFCGSKVTTNAGLLAYRELDEVLSLTEMVAEVLSDSRPGTNKQHGTIDNVPSLEWFQVDPNGKSRIRKE